MNGGVSEEATEQAFRREIAAVVEHRANIRCVPINEVLGDICDPQKQNALLVAAHLPSCPVLPWASPISDVKDCSELEELGKVVHRVIQYAQRELVNMLRKREKAESANVSEQSDAHLLALQSIGIKPLELDDDDNDDDDAADDVEEDEADDAAAAEDDDDEGEEEQQGEDEDGEAQDDEGDAAEEDEEQQQDEEEEDEELPAEPLTLSDDLRTRLTALRDGVRAYGTELQEFSAKLLKQAADGAAPPLSMLLLPTTTVKSNTKVMKMTQRSSTPLPSAIRSTTSTTSSSPPTPPLSTG